MISYAAICIARLVRMFYERKHARRVATWPDSFLRQSSKNMRIDLRLWAELFSRDIKISENLEADHVKALKLGSSRIESRSAYSEKKEEKYTVNPRVRRVRAKRFPH